jgi:predicted house-cleaning noncanonical NTP pyrophosphatase (MazG superfamily)
VSFAKLVRNKVPDLLRNGGANPVTHRAGPAERRLRLYERLREEVGSFLAKDSDIFAIDELADVQEVIRALCAAHGATLKELEQRRVAKSKSHGTFSDWIVWTGDEGGV